MRPKSDLRPYQDRIAAYLYEHDEALCVVRPGGGKTIAALTAIEELIRDEVIRHALVIAPKRVARSVWPDEIEAWAHISGLSYAVLLGTPERRKIELAFSHVPTRDITIIGIDLVQWVVDELLKLPKSSPLFDLLVIDEISKLRDPKGKRAKALAGIAHNWKMIWGLSGTLRPSSAQDLFMPARVVTRAKLWGKSFYKWRQAHFYPTDYMQYDWKPLPGAEDKLNAELAPLTVTLAEHEMPQLPELSVILDEIELPTEARQHYDRMEHSLITDDVIAVNAAVATGKLAQIANGFVYNEGYATRRIHEEKAEWLRDIIEQAAGPTLLIYEFREDLRLMMEILGSELPYLGASVPDSVTATNIKQWNAGRLPFMALHPAAGGHGLNLQHGGADMAWISPTWSPELWEQTIARLHRSGQTRPVIVRVCCAVGTVDQLKLDRVHHKMSSQAAFEAYLRRHHHARSVA
jgi:SNF2 family DNA or RNA helicase